MKRICRINCLFLSLLLLAVTVFCSTSVFLNVNAATSGYVDATNVRIRADASTSSNILGKVSNVYVTVNGSKIGNDGQTWYDITYENIRGYIYGEYLTIISVTDDKTFEQQLESFPESYRQSLRNLHSIYPNWNFYADNVNMTFSEAVELELPNRRKEVHGTSDISWRSMGQHAYDWNTGTYVVDNGNWVAASRELIAYYMDPRNFLNNNDIFTFMQQGYNSQTQTAEGVKKIVSGTFLADGYYDPNDTAYGGSYVNVIMEAARQSGVSPYVLASTIIQEQGTKGNTSLISGTYSNYYGYYNFFNVKASGSNQAAVIANGLSYAKSMGWTTRSASIIGGAKFIGNDYIANGQDTYYYMNYNVLNPDRLWKQYAQAVHNALQSGRKVASTYSSNTQAPLTFRIPVYKNMPGNAAACPAENSKRNNYYFTSISVSGLTPTFTMFNYNYDLKISGNTTINVSVPSGASIVSPASYSLSPGESKVVLTVKSESGYTTDYILNVNASTKCTVFVPGGVGTAETVPETPDVPEVKPDPTPNPGTTTVMRGDTNGDSKISLIDLANIQKHLLGIKILTGDNFKGADTNNDGKISLIDLANIQKHLLGIKLLGQ